MTFTEYIIKKATEDVTFKPMKHNNRHRLSTPIILVDTVDNYRHRDNSYYDPDLDCRIYNHSGLLFREVEQLDFWNEISGWFHSNTKGSTAHPIYDTTNGNVEIPSDIAVISTLDASDVDKAPVVAGTILVDSNYTIYVVYGWYNRDGSTDSYLDFV